MKIEQVTDYDHFKSLRSEWNSFVEKCQWSCVSHTHEWLSSWWEAFGTDADLWVLLLREDKRLMGVMPLMRRKERFRGLPAKVVSFIVNGHSPEAGILLQEPAEKYVGGFLEFLNLNRDEWDVLRLEKVPRKLIEYHNFDGLFEKNAFSIVCADSLNSPYTEISESWDKYYATRSKKFRKVMRNKLNRMRRDGLLQVEHLIGPEVADDVLNEVFDASKQSWKGQLNKSICDDPHVETFYRTLTNVLAPLGKIDLWLMRRNGKVIAFEYHLRHQGITYPIRADFDENYHNLSPGSLLEFFIMKHLFDDPAICGSNSCGATYEYLMNWATAVIERVKLLVFNSRKYSRNLFLVESKLLPMAKRAKILGIQ